MIGIMSIFGIVMIGGGYLGYKKAGSEQSLRMGCFSGIFTAICAVISIFHSLSGYSLFLLLSLILTVVFGIRLFKTAKFMPSGILLLLCIGTAAVTIFQLLLLF